MFKCEICNRKLDNSGNLNQHIKKCEKLHLIKEDYKYIKINRVFKINFLTF